MMRMAARIIPLTTAVVLAAALAGCATAGSPSETSSASPDPDEIVVTDAGYGDPIRVPQTTGVGELVIESATYGPDDEIPDFDVPAVNGGYLIVRATWTTLEGVTAMNGFFVLARDAAGSDGVRDIFVNEVFAVTDQPVGASIRGEMKWDIGAGPQTLVVLDDASQVIAEVTVEATPKP